MDPLTACMIGWCSGFVIYSSLMYGIIFYVKAKHDAIDAKVNTDAKNQ